MMEWSTEIVDLRGNLQSGAVGHGEEINLLLPYFPFVYFSLFNFFACYLCAENLELELDPQQLDETDIRNFKFIVEDWIEQIAMSMLDAFFSKGAGGFKGAKW
jgi:hypothetical protein